jgi:hypothetical protein
MLLTSSKPKEFKHFYLLKSREKDKMYFKKIQPFFENLPADPYLKDNFRFRRLSHFQVMPEGLIRLPHSPLFQGKNYNPLLGDIVREYAPLQTELIALEEFQKIVLKFVEICGINYQDNEIGVHQIRTITNYELIGEPAPEGIHRDGVDWVGIFCINRKGIKGAQTYLYDAKDRSKKFVQILNAGDFLIFDDREFFHFTDSMYPMERISGIRDVFVLTSPGLRAKT